MKSMKLEARSTNKNEPFNSPIIEILIVIALVIFLGLIGSLIAQFLAKSNGADLESILNTLSENNSLHKRNLIRYINLIVHVMSFTLPCLLLAFYMRQKQWAQYLSLHKNPKLEIAFLSILLILISLPFVNLSYWINMQLPLPEWAKTMEDGANEMINALLTMENPWELIVNLIIIALAPALGEELLFRGVFQKVFQKLFQNGHLAVWLAAFLFSAMHMQFEGFIPRFLLGALLGYLFLWSKNLWIPILAHFFFNGIQIVAKYFESDLIENIEPGEMPEPNWVAGIISLGLSIALIVYLKKRLRG